MDLNMRILAEKFGYLPTEEARASKLLDVYYECGESIGKTARQLEINYNTVKKFINKVFKEEEFIKQYELSKVTTVDTIRNDELGNRVFIRLLKEIDDCEGNYQKCLEENDHTNAVKWKRLKIKSEQDLVKMYEKNLTKGGGTSEDKKARFHSDDTELSRRAKQILQ